MEIRILGPLDVLTREGRHVPLRGARQKAVLVSLALRPNEPVSSGRLIHELWGENPPGTAAKVVQNAVSQLRKVLPAENGRPPLLTGAGGYVLQLEPEDVDAVRFERLVEEGRRALHDGSPAEAAATLAEALRLWRGPPLADCSYEPFAQAEIARLEELRLEAIETRIGADLALGRHADLVAELEALVAQHPLRERLRAHLMLALYRAGRQADALAQYQAARTLLREELGLEPGPALQRLERAILTHDEALEPAAGTVQTGPSRAAPAEAEPVETRKQLSVVLAELAPAGDASDPEVNRRPMARAFEAVAAMFERHGARVERAPGGVLAVFGVPVVHEDDALRAVLAATELEGALAPLNAELERSGRAGITVRAGVGTGVALVDGGEPLLEGGRPVATAARLQQAAAEGEVLIGPETERLVRDTARLERLDAPSNGAAWRVLDVVGPTPIPRRLDTSLVGRDRELFKLRQAFEDATLGETTQLFTVLGPAGIGKSRLVAELATGVRDDATVLTGRCLPYGDGITFWPLAEVVRQAAGDRPLAELVDDPERELVAARVEAAIGRSAGGGANEDTFWAVRKLFESVAARCPLVLVFDDLQWAEPTFLDLVEHIADWSPGAPILIVCLARPELLDDRPSWAGGKVNATSILLEPLSPPESEQLIDNLLRGTELPQEVRAQITETAEGNPLFLEQMLAVVGEVEAATGDLAVPPTLHALLAARLDRLDPEERAVLQRASIAGREFARDSVEHLSPAEERQAVQARLDLLARKQLLRAAGDGHYRFRHLLIREAAYESLPKELRADLHERHAEWLEGAGTLRETEIEEILGYHLEQAYRYRLELGLTDGGLARLGERAAERLSAAARRAYLRGDAPAAVSLFSRAAALLEPRSPRRLELLVDLGEAWREIGDFGRGDEVLGETIAAAAELGDPALEARARVVRVRMATQYDPELRTDAVREEAERAIVVFDRLGDEQGLARAWAVLAWAPWLECHAADAEEAAQRAVEYARQAGDTRTEAQALHLAIGAAFFGPTPAAEAAQRCEEILARPRQQRRIAASAYRVLGGLSAMQGDFARARELFERDRDILDDLGLRVTAAVASEVYGLSELLAGDAPAAERELRNGYETLERMGETSVFSNLAAMLAQALWRQGPDRDEEALRFSEISEQASAPDDTSAQVQWRAARAKILARLGRHADAEPLAREAVARAAQTDFLVLRGDALADLGEVLVILGNPKEAHAAFTEALLLYERKGAAVSARNTRARIAEATNAGS